MMSAPVRQLPYKEIPRTCRQLNPATYVLISLCICSPNATPTVFSLDDVVEESVLICTKSVRTFDLRSSCGWGLALMAEPKMRLRFCASDGDRHLGPSSMLAEEGIYRFEKD